MKIFRKTDILLPVLLFLAMLMLVTGCGKKGAPSLRSFEKPDPIKEIRVVHRDGKLNISWTYSNRQPNVVVSAILLYRAEGKGDYREIAKLPAEARRYVDSNISNDKQYRYKVRAFSARKVESEDTTQFTAQPVSPPDAPSGIFYRITKTDIEIEWNKAPQGALFNVYRSDRKGSYPVTPANEKPLDRPFFRDRLNLKAPVYYAIVAFRQTDIPNESGLSTELVIDPATFTPEPPVDLRYLRSGDRGYLTWKDSDEPYVRGYRVYRKGLSGPFKFIGEVNVPVYVDGEKVSAKTTYRVTAVGPMKESLPSAEVGVRQAGE
jgi:hypothetical protein